MMRLLKLSNSSEITLLIRSGQLGILPTDTVYGIAAMANSKDSVERLYMTKRPGQEKPGTIIAANISQLIELGFSKSAINEAKQYLKPGISVIIESPYELRYMNFDKDSQAVRIVPKGDIYELLLESGPLLTSSANLPGHRIIDNIDDAIKIFGNSIDFYVDGGVIKKNLPSTIIRINNNKVEIIRQGSAKIKQ
ncbi:MAG: Sua5/YciO/YrdC/YwlC family protein [bacterium]